MGKGRKSTKSRLFLDWKRGTKDAFTRLPADDGRCHIEREMHLKERRGSSRVYKPGKALKSMDIDRRPRQLPKSHLHSSGQGQLWGAPSSGCWGLRSTGSGESYHRVQTNPAGRSMSSKTFSLCPDSLTASAVRGVFWTKYYYLGTYLGTEYLDTQGRYCTYVPPKHQAGSARWRALVRAEDVARHRSSNRPGCGFLFKRYMEGRCIAGTTQRKGCGGGVIPEVAATLLHSPDVKLRARWAWQVEREIALGNAFQIRVHLVA